MSKPLETVQYYCSPCLKEGNVQGFSPFTKVGKCDRCGAGGVVVTEVRPGGYSRERNAPGTGKVTRAETPAGPALPSPPPELPRVPEFMPQVTANPAGQLSFVM